MIKLKSLLLLSFLFLGFVFVPHQNEVLNKIIRKFQDYRTTAHSEKIYLQSDVDLYYSGEILWFSVRLVDDQNHKPSEISNIVHVRILDSHQNLLCHKKVAILNGVGNGDFLLPDTLSTAMLYIQAYTEWMRNFDEDFFFQRKIYVIDKNVSNKQQHHQLKSIDVSFFPEGGVFVESVLNRLAFKVIDTEGKGVDVEGYIVDDQQDTLEKVHTYKFGMGSFLIHPMKDRTYYLVSEYGGEHQVFMLPVPQQQGIALLVSEPDSLSFEVQLRSKKKTGEIILLSHSRGKVNFAAEGNFTKNLMEIRIPKSRFDPGINHLTVFDGSGKPLVERLIFIQPGVTPKLKVTGLKDSYGRREKVNLNLQASEKGSITISVHKRPRQSDSNIVNYLLLNSDIKGYIENPEFYFHDTDSARLAAEHLMLTQGWTRFMWEDVLSENNAPYLPHVPEKGGPILRVKLFDKLGQIVDDTLVILSAISDSPNFIFNRVDKNKEEMLFAAYGIHGPLDVVTTVYGDANFNEYTIKLADEYDMVKAPDEGHVVDDERMLINLAEDHVSIKDKENFIKYIYKLYDPNLYPIPEVQQPSNEMIFNALKYPDYDLNLNEYISLNSLSEIIFELVPSALVKNKHGKKNIYVINDEANENSTSPFNEEPAIAFLNGVPVFDHDLLFNLEPNAIDRIQVFTGKYRYDSMVLHGFFSIITKETQDTMLFGTSLGRFRGISLKREFYSPKYEVKEVVKNGTIPDLRHLIYWNPNFVLSPEGVELTFNTSDIVGPFYLTCEGITESGKPVWLSQKIDVSD